MLRRLLPNFAVSAESYGDDSNNVALLYPEEAAAVAGSVEKRRREFATVRACARSAMMALGIPPQSVVPGQRGAPRWPEGVVGSMTHCEGYRAVALARAGDLASLGIDAEPHSPLPDGVLDLVSLSTEQGNLKLLAEADPYVHWDRLLFSAKEAVYKAWFPLTQEWLDFGQVDIKISRDRCVVPSGRFRARLLVPGPVVGGQVRDHFDGQWAVQHGLVFCAVAVPASEPAAHPLPGPEA
ncbi:MAG: 4'-phosphopantetheinyl transferase [Pseudoxanthomonas suwonensis]|nr:MAG: 4'-phosphopantetheinyl transferase [Pseudoxanthomonas suwonensis]